MQPLVDAWCADLDSATRTLPNLTMVLLRCRTGTATQRRQMIQSLSRLTARLQPFALLISATDSEEMTEGEETADAETSDAETSDAETPDATTPDAEDTYAETSDAEDTDADEGDTSEGVEKNVGVCRSTDVTESTELSDDETSKERAATDAQAQQPDLTGVCAGRGGTGLCECGVMYQMRE